MDKDGQVMPSFDAMANTNYSPKQWLQYYRNIWVRNRMGSMCDVMHDGARDPQGITGDNVQDDLGRVQVDDHNNPVKKTYGQRLEERKEQVKRANGIIEAIDKLMALDDADLEKMMASDSEFLAAIEQPKPVEEAKPSLASFTVCPGKQVVTADAVTHAENTTVDLDPEDQVTKQWVADGLITPTRAL